MDKIVYKLGGFQVYCQSCIIHFSASLLCFDCSFTCDKSVVGRYQPHIGVYSEQVSSDTVCLFRHCLSFLSYIVFTDRQGKTKLSEFDGFKVEIPKFLRK
jgi:hypothetical protein